MFSLAKIIWVVKGIIFGVLGFYKLEVDGLGDLKKFKGTVQLFQHTPQDSTKVELEFGDDQAFITQRNNDKPVQFSLFNKILKTNLDQETDMLFLFLPQNNGKARAYFELKYAFERNNIQSCTIEGINDFEVKAKIHLLANRFVIRMSEDKVKCSAMLCKQDGKLYLANFHNNKMTQFDLFDRPLYISSDSFLEFKRDGDRIILSFSLSGS